MLVSVSCPMQRQRARAITTTAEASPSKAARPLRATEASWDSSQATADSGFLISWRLAFLLALAAIMQPVPLAPSWTCRSCLGEGGRVGGPLWPASWPELSNAISSTVFCLVKAVQKRQSLRGPHDYRPRCETSWPGPRRGEGNMAADSGFLIGWRMGNGKFFGTIFNSTKKIF